MSIKYRKDIDGLRALAVLPVILFHAGFQSFEGGFVGVDIFFVISGYLITSIIINSIEDGTFSLYNFYLRRTQRIVPALLFMTVFCVYFSHILLPDIELRNFYQSLASVTLFSSNILFWLESGYFDTASELKPLLHTWSLAVEEQYYMIFPLFMIFSFRKWNKRFIFNILLITLLLSFTLSCFASSNYPTANFYLFPFRAWEILIGACLAFLPQKSVGVKLSNFFSSLGLLLILGSIALISSNTPFPGVFALPPTIGTALIIYFHHKKSVVHQLLSWNILVSIGLISYSAYLWHQPIIAFYHSYKMISLNLIEKTLLSTTPLIIGYLSWKYIETPFRKGARISSLLTVRLSIISSVIFLSLGVYGHFSYKPNAQLNYSFYKKKLPKKYKGILLNGKNCSFPKFDNDVCKISGFGRNNSLVLVGDSHARVLSQAFYEDKKKYSSFYDLSASGCPFLLGLNSYHNYNKTECTKEYQDKRLQFIINKKKESEEKLTVILHARWPLYLYGNGFDNKRGGVEKRKPFFSAANPRDNFKEREAYFFQSLRKTITSLSNISDNLIIILPTHVNGWHVLNRAVRLQGKINNKEDLKSKLSIDLAPVIDRRRKIVSFFNQQKKNNVILIDPLSFTCSVDQKKCYGYKNNNFLFTDTDHLSFYVNDKLKELVYKSI